MLNCAEEILKKLKFLIKLFLLSTGDMGFSAEKTFDIEDGYPQKKNIEKFQAVHLVQLFNLEEWC